MIDDLKTKYHQIRSSFSKDESFEWWERNASRRELCVYQVNTNTKKLSFRAYDDTPSVTIYDGLSYVDFGGDGVKKDPVARIMEVTGLNFPESLKLFMSWTGENIENFIPRIQVQKEEKALPYKTSYIRGAILNKNSNISKYNELAKDLFRGCSPEEQRYAERVLHIGYIEEKDKFCDRIFIPEMDESGIAYGSYRYNRHDDKKGLLRANSKRILFGSHMAPKYKTNLLYVEGHSDAVINIAKRHASLTTGSATKKLGENIYMLKGKTIFDFPDLDIPGIKGAMSRREEILEYNKTLAQEDQIKHHIFLWADWTNSKSLYDKIINGKISDKDGDMLHLIKDRIPLKKEHAHLNKSLIREIQVAFCKNYKWDISNHDINDWKVIFKGKSLQYGFDFADFYQMSKEEQEPLLKFLEAKVRF